MQQAQTPYQLLGEQGIMDLAAAFYDIMATLPEAAGIRAMLKEPLLRIADAVRNREGPGSAGSNPDIIAAG